LDSEVFNLFQVVMNQKEELEKAFYMMPIHSDLLEYWKKNKETDPIKKALRFLLFSNFGYIGQPETLHLQAGNAKQICYNYIDKTFEYLSGIDGFDIKFSNSDFRKFLKSISYGDENDRSKSFIYCDPPYLGTGDNYNNSFTEQDSIDLFDTLQATGCKYAMSEFNHPFILQQAKERGLNVHIIGEHKNIKNRRTEILVTNYKNNPTLFDTIK
jgi:DNA adenine methylase